MSLGIPLRVAAALAFAWGLWACDEDVARRPVETRPGCDTADDCPRGLDCVEGVCVGGSAPEWPLRLRFRPADEQLTPVDMLEELHFSGTPVLRVRAPVLLPRRAELLGTALREGVPQRVRVTARALSGIGAQPLTYTGDPADADDEPAFLLGLPAWWPRPGGELRQQLPYALQVRSDHLPPFSLERPINTSDELPPIDLPTGEMVTVFGVVLVSPGNPVPLNGLRVVAQTSDGAPVSTVATTGGVTEGDAPPGQFTLALWPSDRERTISLRVTSDQQPLPEVTHLVTVPAGGSPGFQQIFIGETGRVFGAIGRVGTPEEAVRARIEFDGQVGNGRFRWTTSTDEAGGFALDLYPGRYDVEVIPSADGGSPYRISRTSIEVAPDSGELVLPLRPRIVFEGQVLDPAGQPVAQAAIETELVRAIHGEPGMELYDDAPPARSDKADTNADGRFVLSLDRGLHRLTITPLVQSGLPAIEVMAEVSPGRLPGEVIYVLPAAAAVVVDLARDPASPVPVAGVVVEAWRTDGDVPRRIARGTSDARGRVTLALPNEPAPETEAPADPGP